MKIALVFPVPADALDLFKPDIERFFRTLHAFDPGCPFELHLVHSHLNRALYEPVADLLAEHEDVLHYATHIPYTGLGADIGSHQHAAHSIDADLMVCCSTRVHFHRAGWLKPIVSAWENYGPGLYGAMACFERTPHIRTCFYAMSPETFRNYPHLINSRESTFRFETGEWCIGHWVGGQGMQVRMVTWQDAYPISQCRMPQNIYRRGDQSNCLVWDRHTEIYSQASPEEKWKLERYAGDK